MIMRARERESAWVITGMSLIGLVGVVAYAATEPTTWLSFVALIAGVVIAGFVIARAGLSPPLVARARDGTVWSASCGGPVVPVGLLMAAIVATIGTALVADRRDQLQLTHTTVAAVWLLSLALLLAAAWWRAIASACVELSAGGWRFPLPSRKVLLAWNDSGRRSPTPAPARSFPDRAGQ
jgi:hypothetical protein